MFQKYFPITILVTAIIVSCSAGYYSVTGLSKLFAGATIEVIIMASSLEFAKLVLATSLKLYWNKLSTLFKVYSTVAVTILIIITSIGIYGFLSSAYQITSTKNSISNNEISILESKKIRFDELKKELLEEKNSLTNDMSALRTGMNNAKDQTIDRKTGQILSKTNNSIKIYQSELESSSLRKQQISLKIENLNDSISIIDGLILDKKQNNTTEAELGPLIFLRNLLGYSMDSIVNVLIIMLMLVFDPLAISMLIIAISLFQNKTLTPKKEFNYKDGNIELPSTNLNLDGDVHLKSSDTLDIKEDAEPKLDEKIYENDDIQTILNKMEQNNINNIESSLTDLKSIFNTKDKIDNIEHEFYNGNMEEDVNNNDKLSTSQKKNMSQWQIKHHNK